MRFLIIMLKWLVMLIGNPMSSYVFWVSKLISPTVKKKQPATPTLSVRTASSGPPASRRPACRCPALLQLHMLQQHKLQLRMPQLLMLLLQQRRKPRQQQLLRQLPPVHGEGAAHANVAVAAHRNALAADQDAGGRASSEGRARGCTCRGRSSAC